MDNRILLVEDDKEISEMLKSYLEAENYEVVCAIDGEEACTAFDRSEFSLVLLDPEDQWHGCDAAYPEE